MNNFTVCSLYTPDYGDVIYNLKNDCERLDKVLGHIASTPRVQTLKDLSEAYKSLLELYKSGGLTEKEYNNHKRKVLGQ